MKSYSLFLKSALFYIYDEKRKGPLKQKKKFKMIFKKYGKQLIIQEGLK